MTVSPSECCQLLGVRGMVAWTVVLVLTLCLFIRPVRVNTFSVTWTEMEPRPSPVLMGVPDSTPAEESVSPFGSVTFFHLSVVL